MLILTEHPISKWSMCYLNIPSNTTVNGNELLKQMQYI